MKQVRISAAEIARAKFEAAEAGLRLVGLEKRPDGTLKYEFDDPDLNDDWRDGSPLYEQAS